MNKIIIPLPKPVPKFRDVYIYNLPGELLGVQNVSDWTDSEVSKLIVAIKSRDDGSYAVLKERSEE